jgi:hypothetical protein
MGCTFKSYNNLKTGSIVGVLGADFFIFLGVKE